MPASSRRPRWTSPTFPPISITCCLSSGVGIRYGAIVFSLGGMGSAAVYKLAGKEKPRPPAAGKKGLQCFDLLLKERRHRMLKMGVVTKIEEWTSRWKSWIRLGKESVFAL